MTDQQGQPSGADLDAVAAEQKVAEATTAPAEVDPKVAEAEAYVEGRGYDPEAAKRIVAQFGADHFIAEKARLAQGSVVEQAAADATEPEQPSDTGDQISKAVEPAAKSFITPTPEEATPGERLAKLEADFAALVKGLDEQFGIRPC